VTIDFWCYINILYVGLYNVKNGGTGNMGAQILKCLLC